MVEGAIGEMLGSDRVRPIDYMRAFVIDAEFFNQSTSEITPRSSRRSALKRRLDTADIVRDGREAEPTDLEGQTRATHDGKES
jgi:hypothetical protein